MDIKRERIQAEIDAYVKRGGKISKLRPEVIVQGRKVGGKLWDGNGKVLPRTIQG